MELPPSVDARPRGISPEGSSSPTSPVDRFLTCIRAAELGRFQSPVHAPPPPPPPLLLPPLPSRASRHPSPASRAPTGDSDLIPCPCPSRGGVPKPPPPPPLPLPLPPSPSATAEVSAAAAAALAATGLCSGVVVAVVDGVVVVVLPVALASSVGLGGRAAGATGAATVAAAAAASGPHAADDEVRSDRSRDSYARARRRLTDEASARDRRHVFTSRTWVKHEKKSGARSTIPNTPNETASVAGEENNQNQHTKVWIRDSRGWWARGGADRPEVAVFNPAGSLDTHTSFLSFPPRSAFEGSIWEKRHTADTCCCRVFFFLLCIVHDLYSVRRVVC